MILAPLQTFNFFDAIQSGIISLKKNTLAVLKDNAVLAIAAGLLVTVLSQVFLGDMSELSIQLMAMSNDIGGLLIAAAISALLLAVQVALAMLFVTRTYIQIRNVNPRAFAYTLGSNEPPLFRMSQEEAMVAKATFMRFWRLWPIVIAFVVAALTNDLAGDIVGERLRGRQLPPGLIVFYYFLRFVVIAFLFWTAYKLVRLFFYMTPVAVEQGTVDLSIIKSMAPSRALYRAVTTSIFWKHIFIVVLSTLPVFGILWLFTALLDLIGTGRRGFVGDFAFFTLRHIGYLIGAVFFVGTLSVILGPNDIEEEPLPASVAE